MPSDLTLEEFAERCLRPTCIGSFGPRAMAAFDRVMVLGGDLDNAADLALAIAREDGYIKG